MAAASLPEAVSSPKFFEFDQVSPCERCPWFRQGQSWFQYMAALFTILLQLAHCGSEMRHRRMVIAGIAKRMEAW